jgi:hypothetical protein
VREREQPQAETSRAPSVEWQHRVRSGAEKQRLRPFVVEPPCNARGGKDTPRRKTSCNRRLWCQAAERSQKKRRDFDCRAQQPRVLTSQFAGVATDEACGAVVEWMCECRRRLDPIDVELERVEERRRRGERMDRGADVVTEPRKRQLRGARPAADRVPRLDDEDGTSGLRECERGSEPVRARTDDDCV